MSTPGDSGKPPAGLKVNFEPREPVRDPTLGIQVDVDRTGSPTNRLVTIGDSVTHGFMSGAIFRTDLSWPAIVAYELGMLKTFRYPVYEPPGGPGGIPIDIERALRAFESRFGSKLDWYEIVSALSWLQGYLDDIEDYWERGDGAKVPARKEILHNLAIYGWDLRDTLSLNATKVRARMEPAHGRRVAPEAEGPGRQRPGRALRARFGARGAVTALSPRSRPRRSSASRARRRAGTGTGSRPWS